jgi:hydrogenase small subunit
MTEDQRVKNHSLASASEPIREIDILWITAGLGCDGDTIAISAATQPSLEDILLGALPGIPKVDFHSPFLSYENGDNFLLGLSTHRPGSWNPPHCRRVASERKNGGVLS